ncbi:MAG TPA: hypothetical protein VK181_12505 [Rhizobium sp.]|nr:hypothetical protein [Rhizobium sp.]
MTILHALAQQILQETRTLYLPAAEVFPYSNSDDFRQTGSSGVVSLDNVTLELRYEKFRPDAVGTLNGKRLLIEVLVTHEVDPNKAELLRANREPVIEIDLSKWLGVMFSREQIAEALVSPETPRQWVVHPGRETLKARILRYARQLVRCPHGLGVAGEILCQDCPCLIDVLPDDRIHCTGESSISDLHTLTAVEHGEHVAPPESLRGRIEQAHREKQERAARARQKLFTRQLQNALSAKPTSTIETVDISDYCDKGKIVDTGKRTCMACGAPLTGYAGKGEYLWRTVWLCRNPRHRGIID